LFVDRGAGSRENRVCALTNQWVTAPKVARSLCAKLDVARLASGRNAAARRKKALSQFATLVKKARGKQLTPEHAETLLRLARAL
jgi:hypothetical protein